MKVPHASKFFPTKCTKTGRLLYFVGIDDIDEEGALFQKPEGCTCQFSWYGLWVEQACPVHGGWWNALAAVNAMKRMADR